MKICAGIVLFNPEIERLKKNLDAIISQVENIYIVDNGSQNIDDVKNLIASYRNVLLYRNITNLGIAKALNQMCSFAYENNYQWILTLDQDSVCPFNMINVMKRYIYDEQIGIVCPAINYEGRAILGNKEIINEVEFVSACMTSASLTNIAIWKKVGGFCEEYFIDYVDNEFCMKLSIGKYKILRVNECVLNHQLGKSCQGRFLGIFKYNYSQHTPIRMYYMIRNNLFFIKTYAKNLNIIKEYIKVMYILLKNLWISDQKIKTIKYIFLGIKDYRSNRMGKCGITY